MPLALSVQPTAGAIVRPSDFGADPTGRADSTDAIVQAMVFLLNQTDRAPHKMASGIFDYGGATLDLEGGQYLISQPIVIPPFVGNVQIVRGTLRASTSFPGDRWLVMIGDKDCTPLLPSGKPDQQGSCNEFINLSEMLFDAAHVAAGGVAVAKAMGTTIGPSAFFIGFNKQGVRIDAGHEVMIQQAWFAEYYWSEPKTMPSMSIAVQINGNDHYLTNVIVFDYAHVGVEVNGAANVLQNVHTWNGGGVGIAVNAYQTRLLNCYLDYNSLLITDPSQTVVESSFFLDTNAVLKSDRQTQIHGLRFTGNTYVPRVAGTVSIEMDPAFRTGTDVVVEDEIAGGDVQLKLTRSRRTLHQENATRWALNFSQELLFPDIEQVSYSMVADNSDFVRHVARRPEAGIVVVESDSPITATVVVDVAQGRGDQNCEGSCRVDLPTTLVL